MGFHLHLTQALTGYGAFRIYLLQIHKAESLIIAAAAEIRQMMPSIQYFGALNLSGNGTVLEITLG